MLTQLLDGLDVAPTGILDYLIATVHSFKAVSLTFPRVLVLHCGAELQWLARSFEYWGYAAVVSLISVHYAPQPQVSLVS